jgi:hypothetical protein
MVYGLAGFGIDQPRSFRNLLNRSCRLSLRKQPRRLCRNRWRRDVLRHMCDIRVESRLAGRADIAAWRQRKTSGGPRPLATRWKDWPRSRKDPAVRPLCWEPAPPRKVSLDAPGPMAFVQSSARRASSRCPVEDSEHPADDTTEAPGSNRKARIGPRGTPRKPVTGPWKPFVEKLAFHSRLVRIAPCAALIFVASSGQASLPLGLALQPWGVVERPTSTCHNACTCTTGAIGSWSAAANGAILAPPKLRCIRSSRSSRETLR